MTEKKRVSNAKKARLPGTSLDQTDYDSEAAKISASSAEMVKVVERALYGIDNDLSARERAFCDHYLQTGSASQAGRLTRPEVKPSTAGKWGCDTLCKPQVQAYLRSMKAAVAMRAEADAGELYMGNRIVFAQATGQMRARKTLVDPRTGETKEELVYHPNLGSAVAALENMRKLAQIGGTNTHLTIEGELKVLEALPSGSRAQRIKEILASGEIEDISSGADQEAGT